MTLDIRKAGAVLALSLALWGAGWASRAAAQPERFTPEELEPLIASLESEGFTRPALDVVFHDERLRKVERVVTINVLNPDSAQIYEQFRGRFAIRLARKFRGKHMALLERVERRYGVPKDVIVAILLVETQFGTAANNYRLLDVFTTLIVDASPEAVERHYQRLKPSYPDLQREYLEERLTKKADWAYKELVALLAIQDARRIGDLYAIKGSYAGAFGMPQFLPTSYLAWAVDGNKDRRFDLDNTQDAMASIANFLRQHGWTRRAAPAQKQRAVWEYNHSRHYVDTIFEVARRVRVAPVRTQPAARPAAAAEAQAAPADAAPPWADPVDVGVRVPAGFQP